METEQSLKKEHPLKQSKDLREKNDDTSRGEAVCLFFGSRTKEKGTKEQRKDESSY